jgi:hypothetical protein
VNVIASRASITIAVSAETAWGYLSHYPNDLEWRTGLSRMQPHELGPIGVGALVDETLTVLGRTIESVVEVTRVCDPRVDADVDVDADAGASLAADGDSAADSSASFHWRVVGGMGAHGSRTITPLGTDSCQLELVKEITLTGGDRWLRPIVAINQHLSERGDVRRARAALEARAAVDRRATVDS